VRAVVHAAQTVLFLNPVVRWDGRTLPAKAARVDGAATWLFRGGLLAAGALLLVRARRRQPVLAPNGTPARP
jgi:hypothetical protein